MSALPRKQSIRSEDYLVMERLSPVKHEYIDGEIVQMAGASREHAIISLNINASLNIQLKGRDCTTYSSDLRVHIPAANVYTYPDGVVVCGESEFLEEPSPDTLLNPTLIVEVLSPSTAIYDQGAKFEYYRSIPSLRQYLLVWQDKKRAALYSRLEDGDWLLRDFIGDEARIEIDSVGCVLSMADIYDKVGLK